MRNIIIPGPHGIGTCGITPTVSGYNTAADKLVQLYDEGRGINESDPEIRRVLNYHGASSIRDLKVQRRGW